jgi:putative ABC transport system permease protein
VDVGDTLTLNVLGREITATIANLREVEWSTLALNFAVVFAPGVLEGAPHTELAAIYATAEADAALFDALTGRFSNVSLISVKEVLQNVGRVLSHLGTVFRSLAGLVLGIGFLVLAGALASDQRGRIRDAVVFKVCGATRGDVLGAFATEFLILGAGAGILAAALGTGAAWAVVVGLMDAPFAFPALTVGGTALAGILLTVVLGLAGTARVLGQRPAPFLRGE